jgi:anti-anti-sigma factor
MEIGSERIDTILTVTLTGRLDAFGAKQLTEALKNHITDDDFTVVIDIGGVPYLSSGGSRFTHPERMRSRAV